MYTCSKKINFFHRVCLIISLSVQLGCATQTDKQSPSATSNEVEMQLPEALREPTRAETTATDSTNSDTIKVQPKHIKKLQPLYIARAKPAQTESVMTFDLPAGKLTINAENLPLKDFIHLALDEVLHIPFEMDAGIANRTDPVNLHISKSLPAEQLLEIIEQILDSYDVSLAPIKHGLRVLPKSALKQYPPMLVHKNSKAGYGQVIEVIPLQYVEMAELQMISASIFQLGKYGRTSYNKRMNAVIATGEAGRIKRFKEFVDFLDRPGFKSHQLRMVRPIYWQAENLGKQLINLLKVQGIPASDNASDSSSVVVLAVKSMNALLVTSPQAKWMKQAEGLIKELDAADAAGPKIRTFIYFTQHRPADELGELISKSTGNVSSSSEQESSAGAENTTNSAAQGDADTGETASAQYRLPNLNVVVDNKRSALIFMGTADAYQMVVPILRALDIPVRQVLIEITVADITLDDSMQLGVEWVIDGINVAGTASSFSTLGGLGTAAGGLTYQLVDNAGGVKALVTALATSGKAKILSSPTLLAMDGESAHMQVGTQISVVTGEVSNSQSVGANDTGVVRSFTYIDTGVILDISPTITDHGSIRMKLRQEVSEPGALIGDQPPIFKREVDTVMVANSGQTVLIGGLITHNESESVNKVPYLGDIPYLGALFRFTSVSDRSTELVILITPHIVKDQYDAAELTQAYRSRLGW